jgi:hypothetical protein
MKPDELRAKKDSEPPTSVKLPMCESLIADIRARLWSEEWTDETVGGNALSLGVAYGFETVGRLGEFTHCCDGRRPRRGSNPELELQKRSCANQEAIGSLW